MPTLQYEVHSVNFTSESAPKLVNWKSLSATDGPVKSLNFKVTCGLPNFEIGICEGKKFEIQYQDL